MTSHMKPERQQHYARVADIDDTQKLPPLLPSWRDMADSRIVALVGYSDLDSLRDLLPDEDDATLVHLEQGDLDRVQRAWATIRHLLDDRPRWRAVVDSAWAGLCVAINPPTRRPKPARQYMDTPVSLLPEDRQYVYWRLPLSEQIRVRRAWQTIIRTLQEPTPVKWWERS